MRTIAALLLLLCSWSSAFANRIIVYSDQGVPITVDNLSTYSLATIQTLVIAADRSTRDGCPFDAPDYKGLIMSGDRVIISNNYVAWLDLTKEDGDSTYPASYTRSGELAGFWALDPSTQMFKFFTPAQAGANCWNWPRNQLAPGSDSPTAVRHWWDKYAPPTEHSISVAVPDPNNPSADIKTLYTSNASQGAANGNWAPAVDGQVNAEGSIYYRFAGRLASSDKGQVDITDNNDANGIAAYIQSEIEYYFRATDILIAWRFSPTIQVNADNIYVYHWVAYANGLDEDGTACDLPYPVPAGDQFPATSYTTQWFTQSSVDLKPNYATGGQGAFYTWPAGSVVPMAFGAACTTPNSDTNSDQYNIRSNTQVTNGTWIRVGEGSPPYSSGKPFLTWVHLTQATPGSGTYGAPLDVQFNRMFSATEKRDGVVGFGVGSGPYTQRTEYSAFQAGSWYYSLHALSASY